MENPFISENLIKFVLDVNVHFRKYPYEVS